MQDDELAAFLAEMAGTKPLNIAARADVHKPQAPSPGQLRRRQQAALELGLDINHLSSEPPMTVGPHDPLEFRRDGVQTQVFRKLKQGSYAIETRLDLHRLYVEQAREAVFDFIHDCIAHDVRTALITHGKGERSETPAKLKNCVAHWLKHLEPVQAFVSAQPQHGGVGAVYVMLRKSERAKLANALKHR